MVTLFLPNIESAKVWVIVLWNDREHSIFKCIIFNLLKEYRFFPNYPERQLGLAAVLFGKVHCIIQFIIFYIWDTDDIGQPYRLCYPVSNGNSSGTWIGSSLCPRCIMEGGKFKGYATSVSSGPLYTPCVVPKVFVMLCYRCLHLELKLWNSLSTAYMNGLNIAIISYKYLTCMVLIQNLLHALKRFLPKDLTVKMVLLINLMSPVQQSMR